MPPTAALYELHRCAGTQFDPAVVEAFRAAWEQRPPVQAGVSASAAA
jgi:HD-GYP domain-containing protein (c-di-GMP phosphodiesterase class II)